MNGQELVMVAKPRGSANWAVGTLLGAIAGLVLALNQAGLLPHPSAISSTPLSLPTTANTPQDIAEPVVELPRIAGRPHGPRFGTLVHATLLRVPFDADRAICGCRGVAGPDARRFRGRNRCGDRRGRGRDALSADDPGGERGARLPARSSAAGQARRRRHDGRNRGPGVRSTSAPTGSAAWVVVDFKTDADLGAAPE